MAKCNDFTPSIDAVLEIEDLGFDYSQVLDDGIILTAVTSLTVVVESVVPGVSADPNPQSRLVGSPAIVDSRNTGRVKAAVVFQFGNAIAGNTYRFQCLAATNDGQQLSLWNYMACINPY